MGEGRAITGAARHAIQTSAVSVRVSRPIRSATDSATASGSRPDGRHRYRITHSDHRTETDRIARSINGDDCISSCLRVGAVRCVCGVLPLPAQPSQRHGFGVSHRRQRWQLAGDRSHSGSPAWSGRESTRDCQFSGNRRMTKGHTSNEYSHGRDLGRVQNSTKRQRQRVNVSDHCAQEGQPKARSAVLSRPRHQNA